MQLQYLAVLLFVAFARADEVAQVQPEAVPVVGQPVQQQHQQPAPGQVVTVHSVVEAQPQQVHHVHHQPIGEPQQVHHVQQVGQQQQQHYAASGVIQPVVGRGQPQQYGSASEQYGKPESTGIPANYKPFGSWGLYIGGNPADGYYSNYYKALGNSVDKQQVSSGVEQAAGPVKPALLKQQIAPAASYPYGGANSYADQFYPFDYYMPSELNSGSRVAVVEAAAPSVYSAAGPIASPVQVGAQVYGSSVAPAYGPMEQPMLAYADSYATKRVGAAKGPERVQQVQQQQVVESTPPKGYHSNQQQQARYVYAPQPQQYAAGQAPQVFAYPVPVGSQIVGSQPGTEGAYAPYGVHGYTRYAVKPTVVATSEQYYNQGVHSTPVTNFPVYKQQQQQQHAYQPLGFYGYPLNQLHYSQGSIVPAFGQQQQKQQHHHHQQTVGPQAVNEPQQVSPQFSPVVGAQVEAASSEKSETQSVSNDLAKQKSN